MKPTLKFQRWNFWVWCFAVLMTGGIYASYVRLVHGVDHAVSNVFPWGLITGLNVLCGIAIATGGFTIAASIYVLNLEGYRPIVRASLVISFIGYVVAVLGIVSSPGRTAFQMGTWTRTRFSMESHGLSFFLAQFCSWNLLLICGGISVDVSLRTGLVS